MIPRLLVGAPGIGKTAIINSQYSYCEVVLLSTMTEEDISGLPYHEGSVEHRTEPPLFRRLREAAKQHEKVALFFDEIDKARREVADTLLTLIASRKVGEWTLPDNCDIWAAANPPEWGGGDGVSQAMQSRFCVIEYKPNLQSWLEWCGKEFDNHPVALGVMADISSARAPLLECTGEGWKWRLTCPRTWALALRGTLSATTAQEREEIAKGLLTGNAATALLAHFVTATSVESSARSVAQTAAQRLASNRTTRKPLRIDHDHPSH